MGMSKTNSSDTVSAKINSLRQGAGNPGHSCPLCGNAAAAPFRRLVDGVVVAGCIDAFHTDHADAWHNRPVARQLRLEVLAGLTLARGPSYIARSVRA